MRFIHENILKVFLLVLVGSFTLFSCSNDSENSSDNKTYDVSGEWLYFQSNGGMRLSTDSSQFILRKVDGSDLLSLLLDGTYVATNNTMNVTANGQTIPLPYSLSSNKEKLTLTVSSLILNSLGATGMSGGNYVCYKKVDSTFLVGTWMNTAKDIKMIFDVTTFDVKKCVTAWGMSTCMSVAKGDYEAFGNALLMHSSTPQKSYFTLEYRSVGANKLEVDVPQAVVTGNTSATGFSKVVFTKQ